MTKQMAILAAVIALGGCGKKKAAPAKDEPKAEPAKPGLETEARVQMRKLSKNLQVAYVEKAEFPTGFAPLTPAEDCCKGEGGKCLAQPEAWTKSAVWSALDFQVAEPHRFRYSYDSPDGKTFTVTAVGDLDCDGTPITFTLKGRVENDAPLLEVTEPMTQD